MTKPVVFVTGASGQIGSSTVITLSAKYADKVEIRAGARNPEKADKVKSLAGVTVVQATMGDEKMEQVLSGVDTLYIVTPPTLNRVQLALSTAESAKKAGVKHIVMLCGSEGPKTVLGGMSKEIQEGVINLGVPYTFLSLPFFMENNWQYKDSIVNQGAFYGPVDPDKPFSIVAVEDAGKAAAAILVNPSSYANKFFQIVSDRVTYNSMAQAFSAALGKEIKYVRKTYEDTKKTFLGYGIPEWVVEGLFEMYRLIDAADPIASQGNVETFISITGEQPTDLKKWMAKYSVGFQ